MADVEAVKEIAKIFADQLNAQMHLQRQRDEDEAERIKLREEVNMEMFREIVEEQNKNHKMDTETLTSEFEKIRLEKEQARGRQNQKLPHYDGLNMSVDDWQDKTEAIQKCNKWSLPTLLEALPTCTTGLAKRAFDSLTEDDKSTKDTLFQRMRVKIDPMSERRNKDYFIAARKEVAESMMTYIDRCRQLIRRSGADPTEPFAEKMLKSKIYGALSQTDQKILNATVACDEKLETLIIKADSMMSTQHTLIGAVKETESSGLVEPSQKEEMERNEVKQQHRHNKLSCYTCNLRGHIKKYCPQRIQFEETQGKYLSLENQGENVQAQEPNHLQEQGGAI